ncbi:biotin/lipoyl-containing protein [Arthrobacter sp. TWP1-1]|uniref:biotin/lipoyl-containing protein n=1 Tax=Arthrobacter sp. TWP1-1 TaxID=2804568 RepID=UPI003CE8CEC4
MDILFPMMSGDPAEPGVLMEWRAADGCAVTAYQVIAEVTVNKFDAEINTPVSGTLAWLVAEGDEVAQGAVIATVKEGLPTAVA